jgi:hypothetical protein
MTGRRAAGIVAVSLAAGVVFGATPHLASSAESVTTTTMAPTAMPKTTAPPPDSTVAQLVIADTGVELPAVAGYTSAPRPSVPIAWMRQLDFPHEATGVVRDVQQGAVGIGSVVIVDGLDLADFVARLFDDRVGFERDTEQTDDGTWTVTDLVRSRWQAFAGIPVVTATVLDGDAGQWVWGHDGHTWIALGSLAMSVYVGALIAAQEATSPSNPYDYGLLAGPLYDLAIVPGYMYIDLPVRDALEEMPHTFWGDCAHRLWFGYIVTESDPDPSTMAPGDLGLFAATIGGACADDGFFTDLDGALDGMAMSEEMIGAVTVRRDANNVVAIDGDDVYHFNSRDPATLTEMEPFLTAFFASLG